MIFNFRFRGQSRLPSRSAASTAQKYRDSVLISNGIAQNLIDEGTVVDLWGKGGGLEAIMAICKQKEQEHGDPSFVSDISIWIILQNLLKNQPTGPKDLS